MVQAMMMLILMMVNIVDVVVIEMMRIILPSELYLSLSLHNHSSVYGRYHSH